MKINNLIYACGLLLIAASILLILSYPDSNRAYLIAGVLAFIGFPLNIVGYSMEKNRSERPQPRI